MWRLPSPSGKMQTHTDTLPSSTSPFVNSASALVFYKIHEGAKAIPMSSSARTRTDAYQNLCQVALHGKVHDAHSCTAKGQSLYLEEERKTNEQTCFSASQYLLVQLPSLWEFLELQTERTVLAAGSEMKSLSGRCSLLPRSCSLLFSQE